MFFGGFFIVVAAFSRYQSASVEITHTKDIVQAFVWTKCVSVHTVRIPVHTVHTVRIPVHTVRICG